MPSDFAVGVAGGVGVSVSVGVGRGRGVVVGDGVKVPVGVLGMNTWGVAGSGVLQTGQIELRREYHGVGWQERQIELHGTYVVSPVAPAGKQVTVAKVIAALA